MIKAAKNWLRKQLPVATGYRVRKFLREHSITTSHNILGDQHYLNLTRHLAARNRAKERELSMLAIGNRTYSKISSIDERISDPGYLVGAVVRNLVNAELVRAASRNTWFQENFVLIGGHALFKRGPFHGYQRISPDIDFTSPIIRDLSIAEPNVYVVVTDAEQRLRKLFETNSLSLSIIQRSDGLNGTYSMWSVQCDLHRMRMKTEFQTVFERASIRPIFETLELYKNQTQFSMNIIDWDEVIVQKIWGLGYAEYQLKTDPNFRSAYCSYLLEIVTVWQLQQESQRQKIISTFDDMHDAERDKYALCRKVDGALRTSLLRQWYFKLDGLSKGICEPDHYIAQYNELLKIFPARRRSES